MLPHLRERLFERTDGRQNCSTLVLLDPNHPVATTHPLHRDRLIDRVPTPTLFVVPRDDRMADPDSHPRLLVLRGPDDRGYLDEDLLALTVDCAQQRRWSVNGAYVAGWLISESSPEEIASQIRRNVIVEDLSALKRTVVPLFEPHRLMLATHFASPAWLSQWLGCVSSWFLIDAYGQLRELRPSAQDAAQLSTSPSPDFWHAQSRVKAAREVLLAAVKAQQMIPVDCEVKIDLALQTAYHVGLSDVEDVIFFAVNNLVLPANWHTHPAVGACIAKAVAGEAALTESIVSLPDFVLEALSLPGGGEVAQGKVQRRT